ncbi:hypothetical protein AA0119_g13420 [Alternaria tenuissima]|uniref:Uncharacterized protein n=2 Tax=Alternaria alternata complex TaxID=187734 RepID=A0A4Q4MPG4_ALTAL|nr:hypothetical protein AA0117_g13274 [Alternaria alternata]RYN82556.1 hypothetical protein AA0119_g13420 [Alternaria tenuissima]RYO00077.1 hypothetical protein AA0121_g13437 [Alternaria tenuissima]RYO48048.1 hypothetical protein AA0116_g12934 [Alternaria tenuissima]
MLDWFLDPELRLAIEKVGFSEEDLYNDGSADVEWVVLAKIRDFLQLFENTATVEHVLLSMEFLPQHFGDAKTTANKNNNLIMATYTETSWAKFNHYYNLTDQSPIQIAAVTLNQSRNSNTLQTYGLWGG